MSIALEKLNLAKAKKSETIANIMKIGVNVGKNKLTPKDQAINDYIHCLDKTNGAADYYVVNISSPNTPGLRDLGTDSFLSELEERISPEQLQTTYIKIDPDRTKKSFSRLIEKIAESRFAGIILSNTSSTTYPQKGGLSGSPLLSASNRSLELAYEVHQGSIPTIASGGVLSGRDVLEKILRGASAVQIYTALVYRGADVVSVLLDELWEAMRNAGFTSLEEAQSALVK